jgi:hypothetical protein
MIPVFVHVDCVHSNWLIGVADLPGTIVKDVVAVRLALVGFKYRLLPVTRQAGALEQ